MLRLPSGIGALVMALLIPGVVMAQQPLTCEDALAKARAKIDLMVDVRDRADDVAAEALAVVRKQRDRLQQTVKTLQEQVAKMKHDAETPVAEDAQKALGRQ